MSDNIAYYTDDWSALPSPVMRKVYSAVYPKFLAHALVRWYKFRRMFGWRWPSSYCMAASPDAQIIDRSDLPPAAASKWAPINEQLHDLQFQAIQFRLPQIIGRKQHCTCLLLHSSGRILATLEWLRMPSGVAWEECATLELNSYPVDDPEIMTCFAPAHHLPISDAFRLPFVDSAFVPIDQPLRPHLAKHLARISNRDIPPVSDHDVVAVHLERASRRFKWLLEQQIIRPVSQAEIKRFRGLASLD